MVAPPQRAGWMRVSDRAVSARRATDNMSQRGAEMLRRFTLGYLATLRPDGSPRVHPVTVTVDDTGIYVYAVASTPKGRDLRRDPRYALHAFPSFVDGDFRDDLQEPRLLEGIEMKTSAIFAVAHFRKKKALSLLYISDLMNDKEWQPEIYSAISEKSQKEVTDLAVEFISSLQ
jgi:hypothetical protein